MSYFIALGAEAAPPWAVKVQEHHGRGQARSSSSGRAVKILWFNVSCVEVFLDKEQWTRVLIYGCTKASMTPVYFKCEFIRPFVYSEIDSNGTYFSGVAFGVAGLQGTDGLRHWLRIGIFIHRTLLKYYFSKVVASLQVTVPFSVMVSFSPPHF